MQATARIRRYTVVLALVASAFAEQSSSAQVGAQRVTVPSPTAASLGKFGDIPVSLYTGVPDITIPLATAKGRTLELPIALKYHAGGNRVQELGSWVGLGWALDAGGTITRTVHGLPDDGPNGYYFTGNQLWVATNWSSPSQTFLQSMAQENVDGEPDQFFFSLSGVSGEFVLGPTSSSSTVEYRTIPYQKLKIEPTMTGAGISAFAITTEDGTRYTFGAADYSSDYTFGSGNVAMGSHTGQQYASAWNLTEVRSPGGDVITLTYTTYTAEHRLPGMLEDHHQVLGDCPADGGSTTLDNSVVTQRLTSIVSAANTITFAPAATLRQDALGVAGQPQEPMLDVVTVATPAGTVLRSFKLDHDYSGRLRLTRVSERDRNGVSLPPYVFEYNPMGMPDSWSNAIDHWGFYNGQTGNANSLPSAIYNGVFYAGANRDVDPNYAQAAMLTKITYPTGGYNQFVYESNDYGGIGPSGAMPVDKQSHSLSLGAWQGNDDPTQTFTIAGSNAVAVTVSASQGGADCDIIDCPYTEIVGVNRWYDANAQATVTLNPGTYTLHASTNGTNTGWSSIVIQWDDQVAGKKKLGGGVRIAELRAADALGNLSITKYKYTLASDSTRSSGVINAEPSYMYEVHSTVNSCSYIARASVSTAPLGSGPPVGYSEVLVLHGANGEFGKTRHKFRSVLDANDAISTNDWPFSRPTSAEWERGQQIQSTEYDAAGHPQRRNASVYAFDALGPDVSRHFRGMSAHLAAIGHDVWDVRYNEYEVISGWAYQTSDTSVVFDTTGTSSIAATRSFTYGNTLHLQPTEIAETNSDGTQRITRMRYPADFATGSANIEASAITQMQGTANMPGVMLERWVIKRAGGIDSVMHSELNSFRQFPGGQILPYQHFMLNSPTGPTNFVPASVTSGSFVKDSRYLLDQTIDSVDAYGRLAKQTDARGKVTTYSYGGNANNAFLTRVAKVHDASGTVDLVTSLTYDGDGNVQSIQDEGGSFRYFTYDTFGRLRQVKNNSSTVVKAYGYTYSSTSPNWTFNSASPNAVVDTTFVQQTPTPQSVVTTQYLDGLGRPIQSVTQNGTSFVVTATQYDLMGRSWRSWKPYTRSTSGYDASFATNATSFYNSYLGQTQAKPYVETQYRADVLSRVSRIIPEYIGASPTVFALRGYGIDATLKQDISEATDESGKKTRSFADLFGNEVKRILGYGAGEATTTQFAPDVLGSRVKVTDPRALVTSYGIDTRGLLRTKTSADAGTVNQKYDAAGNLRYSQDANQAAQGQVYFTSYDFAARPLTSGLGAATFSALDPDAGTPPALETTQSNWVVVRQYDVKPSTTAFPWSSFSAQISPLTVANVSGRLAAVASKSNGAWQVSLFSYDADGKLAARYTYTQDNGGASVLTAVNTSVSYTRDLRDAITQQALTVGSSSFTHWYDYDGRGLLWKVYAATGGTKPASPDVTYTYRPSGQVQDRQFQGGPLVPLAYTIREQLATIGDPASTTYPFSARYSYNANGTISSSEFYSAGSPAAQKRYKYDFPSYDALNRLKSADFSSWSGSAWTSTLAYDLANIGYDASGNITALQRYRDTGTLIDNLTYSYPASSNRLSSVTDNAGASAESWDAESGSFTYDANGNTLTAPAPYAVSAVTYDHRNLPTSLTSNGVTSTYRYDDAGERIVKQVGNGDREVYVLDGATTLGVVTVNGSGTPVSWYFNVLAGDNVVGRQPNSGSRSYYQADLLGTTRSVVQGATVVESRDYDAWGVLMPGRTLGSGTKEGFTGKERDVESGLDYFGARYYMAALGRWSAADPLASKHPEWSPYNYVLGNPAELLDPDGRQVSANARGPVTATRTPFTRGPMRPGMWAGAAARGGVYVADKVAPLLPGVSTVQDATAVALGVDFTGERIDAPNRVLSLVGLLTPLSGGELRGAEHISEEVNDAARTSTKLGDDAAQTSIVPYNRRKHYGSTPTKADREALGASTDEVVNHEPPLVKRYYEGDPAIGERPGKDMTAEERRASGSDRSRMNLQPKDESNRQGADMARYSREQKKKQGQNP